MWTNCPEKRLISWREFREHISKLSKEEAIEETARLWSQAPISNQYLAADLIKDWPDPWQLIHYNHYDDISITLGMVYTLVLTDDRFNDVQIIVLQDPGGSPLHKRVRSLHQTHLAYPKIRLVNSRFRLPC